MRACRKRRGIVSLASIQAEIGRNTVVTKNKDGIVGVASIVIAVILFIASFGIREMTKTSAGAGFLPRVTAVILAILGAVLVIRQLRANRSAPANSTPSAPAKATEKPVGLVGPLPVVLNILLFVVYLLLLESIGFLIMTPIYMFLQILLLSDPSKLRIGWYLVVSVAVCTGAYYLFVNFFQVMLPAGILG